MAGSGSSHDNVHVYNLLNAIHHGIQALQGLQSRSTRSPQRRATLDLNTFDVDCRRRTLPLQKHFAANMNRTEHFHSSPLSSTSICESPASTDVASSIVSDQEAHRGRGRQQDPLGVMWNSFRAGVWRKQDWRDIRRSGWSVACRSRSLSTYTEACHAISA